MSPAKSISPTDTPVPTSNNLFAEELIELARAAADLADSSGRKPCLASLRRWALRGCRGHRLETVFLGNRMMTSRQSVARFLAAINGGATPAGKTTTSSAAHTAGEELDVLLK